MHLRLERNTPPVRENSSSRSDVLFKPREHTSLLKVSETSSLQDIRKLTQEIPELNSADLGVQTKIAELKQNIEQLQLGKKYRNSQWWNAPERNRITRWIGNLLDLGQLASHINRLKTAVDAFKNQRPDSFEPQPSTRIQSGHGSQAGSDPKAQRLQLAGEHLPKAFVREEQNPLSNFENFNDMKDSFPILHENYARRNAYGDGSCWLTAMLDLTFESIYQDPKKYDNFLHCLENTKEEFARAYPDGGRLVDEISNLIKEMKDKSETERLQVMEQPENIGILRRFVRQLVAMKGEGLGLTAERKQEILEPNTEGELAEIMIFCQYFGIKMHVLDTANSLGTDKKYGIVATDFEPLLEKELVDEKKKLLLFSSGHYSIAEPIHIRGGTKKARTSKP